jgi:hypothetical protein
MSSERQLTHISLILMPLLKLSRFLKKNPSIGFKNDDLAIAIGSDVYVPDIPDNAFDSNAASDSYSCLGSGVTINEIDNNKDKPFQNIAIISLAMLGLVFPEAWDKDRDIHSRRAIISRYIVTNIAHFLGGRIFARDLDRDIRHCVWRRPTGSGERERHTKRKDFVNAAQISSKRSG